NKVVNYMGGMAQGELPSFYQSLDVFVFPTIRKEESLGLVGLEAMACGIPSICSDIGGIKTYIEDGVNGYLFTPGSHEELADSLLNYSGLDLSEFLHMSDHAIKTAKKYDRKVVISDLRKKLAGLLK
ncbi:glycosyltransferase, partial [Alcaligenaceae bacterium 429]